MKKTLIKISYYFYAMLLLGFSISILMLIATYFTGEKEIYWNRTILYFGIYSATILITKYLLKKAEKNVG